jgi:membrane associated rhomboid family serine protease
MFNSITPVVKNLIIINVIFFLASMGMPEMMYGKFAGYYFKSPNFAPWQIVTHMFMHGNFMHILFNMFGLFVFGSQLERLWGSKRFLIYYMVCGVGAYLLHFGIVHYEVTQLLRGLNSEQLRAVFTLGETNAMVTESMQQAVNAIHTPVVGASGAVFGLLLGFGMLFPNTILYLNFLFPVKAKYFVMGYGAIELFMAFQNRVGDSVAHFAHLGGMLFGYILLKIWQKRRDTFY